MTVLLGRTSAGTNPDFEGAGSTVCWPFVAAASGNLAVIFAQTKVANATATGVRLGIYANSGGFPGALLGVASVDSLAAARGTGVFQATLGTPVAIVAGTTYHLGWFAATEQFDFQGNASGAYATDTAADFVNPFVTATTGTTDAIIWGEDAVSPEVPKLPGPILFPLAQMFGAGSGPRLLIQPTNGAAAAATTPVDGDALDLVWDTAAAADGTALDLVWDLRAEATGISLDLVWDTRAQADGISLDLLWDLRAQADGIALDLLWDLVAQANGISLDAVWDLRAQADGGALDLLWDLRAAADGIALDLLWDLRAAVAAAPLDLVWDLASDATPVNGAPLDLVWDVDAEAVEEPSGSGVVRQPLRKPVEAAPSGVNAPRLTLRWEVEQADVRTLAKRLADERAARAAGAADEPVSEEAKPRGPRARKVKRTRPSPVNAAPMPLYWGVSAPVDAGPVWLYADVAVPVDGEATWLYWDVATEIAGDGRRLRWDLRVGPTPAEDERDLLELLALGG